MAWFPPAKALFFSFVACARNWLAILVYSLALIVVATFVPGIVLAILIVTLSDAAALLTVVLTVLIILILSPTLYASFYVSYREVLSLTKKMPERDSKTFVVSEDDAMSDQPDGKPLGIFGGTFDPVHLGHLRLAEEAADALDLGSVRWIPAGRPAHRQAPQVSARERLAMVRLVTADNPRFAVDSTEVDGADRNEPSYAVPTLERLRQACGRQRPLVLLLGADAFARLPAWHRWQSLFDLAHVAIAFRPVFQLAVNNLPAELAACYDARFSACTTMLAESPAGRIVTFATTPLAISATAIRALIAAGASPRYLLPESVLAHIRSHHLYTPDNPSPGILNCP